jgi:hypothetical protein
MELNEKERKMVAYLRNQHAAWPVTRWIILVCSLLVLAVAITGYVKEWAFYIFAVYGLSHSIGCWNGRPEISLLLRLVEEKKSS